ncbi:MAG: hypothetical protein U5K74_09025 [Gemmatimonadaceae bacterium]|nr:hypothetical protein [Gemmatimonadaceae bacterium]
MPVPALPALPPRSATEIVDGAVQLIRPQFSYFLRIAAIGAIPALVQAVITLIVFPTTPTDPAALLRQQATLFPLTLLTYAFATVQSGAIIAGALALLRGDPLPSVWHAFLSAFRRILALLGANILLVIVMMIVFLPVIAVGAFLAVSSGATLAGLANSGTASAIVAVIAAVAMLALLLFVFLTIFARSAVMTSLVIAEGLGPIASLKRSQALSRGSYLLLAKTYGLVLVIVGVVYLVLAGLLAAFQDQQQLVQALMSVIMIPVIPIIGSIMLLTYADLRVRREGADLDAALDALGGAGSLTAS